MKLIKLLAAAVLTTAAVTASAQELPETLYLIGDATCAGWNNNYPEQMVKVSDTEFTYTGIFKKGEFKLPWVKGDGMWGSNTFMPLENGQKVTGTGLRNSESYLTHNGQPDQKWYVEDPGVYKLTFRIDITDTNFGTLDAEPAELPNSIFMLGAATERWYSDSPTVVPGADGKYTWTGPLNFYGEDKMVKFALSYGDWDKITFLVPTETNLNGNVLQVDPGTYSYQESAETEPGALKDWFWGIRECKSGEYEITVDTNAKTVSFRLLKSYAFDQNNTTELYMLGLAADSFDSEHPLPMTALGNGKFSWSGNLDFATADGDDNHANKQFKFVTPTGPWNKVYYLVPTGAEADGYIQEVTPGTYPVKMSTWTEGRSGVDAFFGVTSGTKGIYTVIVDVPNMSFDFIAGNSGVEEIEATAFKAVLSGSVLTIAGAEGEVAVYDIAGRKLLVAANGSNDASLLAAGIYVVSDGRNTVKLIKK